MIDHKYAPALMLLTALAGCSKMSDAGSAKVSSAVVTEAASATEIRETTPVVVADTSEAPAAPASALRASFKACVDTAGGVDPSIQACISEEYAYQDTRLNTAYGALRKSFAADRMVLLRTEQRGWIVERDRNCAWDAKTEGSAQRLQANYCQMETTAKRADALEEMLRGVSTAGGAAETRIETNAAPDDTGRTTLSAGDLRFELTAPSCRPVSNTLSVCDENVELTVTRADAGSQKLRPAALYLNAEGTLYRGPVAQRDRRESQTIIVSDVNGDGRDDLSLWTGMRGGYGSASYDIHLFDTTRKTFVLSSRFSELTVGRNSFFTVADGRIRTTSKSGCCLHTEEFFVVENNAPKLVERIVEDATAGREVPKRTVSKLVDGRMQAVKE